MFNFNLTHDSLAVMRPVAWEQDVELMGQLSQQPQKPPALQVRRGVYLSALALGGEEDSGKGV